jgi:tetratricopeptide (TPR) repeat protein
VGLFLSYLGYYSEGIQLSKRAVDLDPLQSWSYFSLTHALAVNGNFNEALASWIKENQISNRKGISTKVHLLVLSGQPKEAFELLDKISSEEDKLFLSAAVSFSLNQSQEAERYLRDFNHKYTSTNPHAVSELLVFFGNKEEALRILDAVVLKPITAWSKTDEWFRFALFLRASPYLIPLRDDPRFKEICKKYKYPDIE